MTIVCTFNRYTDIYVYLFGLGKIVCKARYENNFIMQVSLEKLYIHL